MINYIANVLECYIPMWRHYLVYIVGFALVVCLVDFVNYLIYQKYKRW